MPDTLRSPSTGPGFAQGPLPANRRLRKRTRHLAWAVVVSMVVALAGCSSGSNDDAPPEVPVAVSDMQRFPSPPDSRSLGAMDEAEARLTLPLGPADAAEGMPGESFEGRVFRRVSMVSTGVTMETLLAHYRGLIAEGGYAVLFECAGVEDCGGAPFVSEVVEAYVTAPGNVSRAGTVIGLTQPSGGELQHFSLSRDHAGAREYVSITISRSAQGPLMVVTQQAFVAAGN